MTELIRDSYRYRELIWALALKELKIRYKRSVLGFMWALLNPALHDAGADPGLFHHHALSHSPLRHFSAERAAALDVLLAIAFLCGRSRLSPTAT